MKKPGLKIVSVVGARPQFIKYLSIHRAISKKNAGSQRIRDILVHTGQHYDYRMSDIFFKELNLPKPDYHLEVGSGSHGAQTGKMLERLEKVLVKIRPDVVVVFGDTNSTLAGALAAAKLHIPVAHVEAGLRSFNKEMPEENNRVLTDHLSSFLFCPNNEAIANLKREGVIRKKKAGSVYPVIRNVGDVMFDILLAASRKEKDHSLLDRHKLKSGDYDVLTLHRAENTATRTRLVELFDYLDRLAGKRKIVFPVHPRTEKLLNAHKIRLKKNLQLITPLGYNDMMTLVRESSRVFTDSGGLQKEAYWLKVPCVTLRDQTEWPETVESGWNILYRRYKGKHPQKKKTNGALGTGQAGDKIVKILLDSLGK